MKNKNLKKTLLSTLVLSLVTILIASWVQTTGQSNLSNCSYFDPATIDFIAFIAGIFLIMEGLIRIFTHKYSSVSKQLTRILRINIGCAILTLHTIQFFYK